MKSILNVEIDLTLIKIHKRQLREGYVSTANVYIKIILIKLVYYIDKACVLYCKCN